MNASEGFGEYTLSARRHGEGLLLSVKGNLRPASARSLHLALCAICCEEESRDVDVNLDLTGLILECETSIGELAATVGELLAESRKVVVGGATQSLVDRLKDAGVSDADERLALKEIRP